MDSFDGIPLEAVEGTPTEDGMPIGVAMQYAALCGQREAVVRTRDALAMQYRDIGAKMRVIEMRYMRYEEVNYEEDNNG
jgi:hypothetical protein